MDDDNKLNELSRGLLDRYKKSAARSGDKAWVKAELKGENHFSSTDPDAKEWLKRVAGRDRAISKTSKRNFSDNSVHGSVKVKATNEEVLDEATHAIHVMQNGKPAGKIHISAIDDANAKWKAGKMVGQKPFRGYTIHKITRINEKVEQVDELSRQKLGNYIKSAHVDREHNLDIGQRHLSMVRDMEGKSNQDYHKNKFVTHDNKAWNRRKGIDKAADRLMKEDYASYKKELPSILKDIRGKKISAPDMRRKYGSNWKHLCNSTSAEHGSGYNRDHLLTVGNRHLKEDAPVNSAGGGGIDGIGVGPKGEPGVSIKNRDWYKQENKKNSPKAAGRKTFSQFMKGV